MKKIVYIIAICLLNLPSSTLRAQSPGSINYQAVARDSMGNILANSTINLEFKIHDLNAGGTVVFDEQYPGVTTNQFGLFSIAIGDNSGTLITGTIGGVDWASGTKFLEVMLNGLTLGTSQLVSVPYALYAEHAGQTGQSSSNYYGTGYTFVSATDTTFKLINGLSETINVPVGVTTILQTTGSAYGSQFSAWAQLEVALFVDGIMVSPGGNEIVYVVTDNNLSSGGGNWSINRPINLTAGSHAVEVKVRGQIQAQTGITIDNGGSYGNSVLTVTYLKN